MKLEGSCHCGAVRFRLRSAHPYPYQRCYCSICRKTQGGGGHAINLGGDAGTLRVSGRQHVSIYHANQHVSIYHAKMRGAGGGGRAKRSPAERHFCSRCGSALWLYDKRWPDLVHPFASAIDTPLPAATRSTHIMLGSKAPWVEVAAKRGDKRFDEYPDESIAEWHERLGLAREGED